MEASVFRQALDEHGLSLEKGTRAVPSDGYYYVLFRGKVQGKFKSLPKAQARYAEIKKTLHLQPVDLPPLPLEELRRLEASSMSNKQLLWTDEDFIRVGKKTQGKKGSRSAG